MRISIHFPTRGGVGLWLDPKAGYPATVGWCGLSNIILRVRDLETSLSFYRDRVGLRVIDTSAGFAALQAGEFTVLLNENRGEPRDETTTELVLEVDDVVAQHGALSGRGVPFEVDPRPVTEHEGRALHAAHFRDPDGHLWSITGWIELDAS